MFAQNYRKSQPTLEQLVNRCLLQRAGQDVYRIHPLVVDFARIEMWKRKELVKRATLRQAQYLSTLSVVQGYIASGEFNTLIAFWRVLEELSGDSLIDVKMYRSSLGELDGGKATEDHANVYGAVGKLFALQVRLSCVGHHMAENGNFSFRGVS